MAVILQQHFLFFVTVQNVGGVKWLDYRLYSGDGDKGTAVIDEVMAKGSLQLSSMRLLNVTKRVLHILDLVHSDTVVHYLLSGSVKATDVNRRTLIGFLALDELPVVLRRQGCTKGGQLLGLFGQIARHWSNTPRIHTNGVHILRLGRHLIRVVKHVKVALGLHKLLDDSQENGNEVTAFVVGDRVVSLLATECLQIMAVHTLFALLSTLTNIVTETLRLRTHYSAGF